MCSWTVALLRTWYDMLRALNIIPGIREWIVLVVAVGINDTSIYVDTWMLSRMYTGKYNAHGGVVGKGEKVRSSNIFDVFF